MNLEQKFILHLKQFSFIQKNEKHILAVSGGADSVVLCGLMHHTGYNFDIAHCNFRLRDEESERDEKFVLQLGEQYDKNVYIKKFNTTDYAAEKKISVQVAARELRYNWFRELLQDNADHHLPGNSFILTAHHANDNLETVVMNFFRGTGLQGLTGMDNVYRKIFRPLLPFRKEEILAYAKENNLAFVEDSSNANSYYTRNYFRNELLPALKKVFPQVEENILENINRLGEANYIYRQAIELQKRNLLEKKGKEEHIAILKLQKQVAYKTILWEILKEKSFTAAQTAEVVKLMDSNNGSYIESPTHRIIKNRRWLIIALLNEQPLNDNISIAEADKKVSFAEGEIHLKKNIPIDNFTISDSRNIVAIDASLIQYPLLLRRQKQGDYFYPLGMQKKKKISRFFIDQKLSATEKEKVWILESNKKIVWILNQRIDDRFKITGRTKKILKIIFQEEKEH